MIHGPVPDSESLFHVSSKEAEMISLIGREDAYFPQDNPFVEISWERNWFSLIATRIYISYICVFGIARDCGAWQRVCAFAVLGTSRRRWLGWQIILRSWLLQVVPGQALGCNEHAAFSWIWAENTLAAEWGRTPDFSLSPSGLYSGIKDCAQ